VKSTPKQSTKSLIIKGLKELSESKEARRKVDESYFKELKGKEHWMLYILMYAIDNLESGLSEAINEGLKLAREEGLLRASVCDPLTRKNTGTNTPAVIHYELFPGEELEIWLMPKGCGSENMSALVMLSPSAGLEGVKNFVIETIKKAGPNPCPPVTVGVGIGGDFEKCALLAKKALFRDYGEKNPDPKLAELEEELLLKINELGIGPLGLGGKTTCLEVRIETAPCHIASLPVAVNVQCHAARTIKLKLA
jgi:fumarate hydratase subunit alpha